MRKLLAIFLFIPFLGMSQAKNVLNSTRVFPKPDKIAEFQKALTEHAKKYHTGDWKWRVWDIQSGPDAGGYMITEGPNSWDRIDSRGDISAEHTSDWNKNVAPLTEGLGSQTFLEFSDDLSTVQITDYAEKIVITHVITKPGKIFAAGEMVKKMKKAWESGGETVAVYRIAASGAPGYLTVARMKAGLKEMADGYRKPMKERYNAANGEGSYDVYLKDYADNVEKRWSELLIYQPNLSSN
jgi:hypothetical protein